MFLCLSLVSKPYYWEMSEVVRSNVTCIPLASSVRIEEERDEQHCMLYHERGLRNFRPWSVHKSNSASNLGLMNIITDIHKVSLAATARGEYTFVRVDVSIFRSWCMYVFFHCPLMFLH